MTPTPDTRQTRTKRARVARHLVALATATATALLITGGAYAAAENPNITAKDDTGASTGKYGRSAAASGSGYAVAEDGRLDVPASRGVLANDTGSGRLTAKLYKATSHGYLTLRRDGSFTYLPFANYYGPDAFRYRACNSAGCSKPATTSIPGADGHPQTQYAARVSDVLKGRLTAGAEVTISQTGGKGLQSRKTYVVEGVAARGVTALDKPLKPGTEYLFCTVPDPANGWHTLSAQPWGDTPLFQNRDRVLDEFERAVRTQADPYAQGGPQ